MPKKKRELSPFEKKLNDWVADHLTRIPFVQKIFFVEHLRTMLHAGISLVEALGILHDEMENKKLQHIIEDIQRQTQEGKQLSEALATHPEVFPSVYIKMIAAGEVSGKLEESLEQIEVQMKKSQALASSIRGAMIYPAVVITAMGSVGVLMVTVVLPKLMVLFKEFDTTLPLPTRILIAITDIMGNPLYLSLIIIGVVGGIVAFIMLMKRSPGFRKTIHSIMLKTPIFGRVIKEINLARFSLTLSSLMKSAIPIIDAVDITADTCSNVRYQEALHYTTKEIQTGTPLSETLRHSPHLFPPIVTEMIMVGERSGDVDSLLTELSNFYGKQVDKTMKNFTTIIEPVIILLLGLAVAGMAVAVIMPMYTLVQNF